MQQNMKLTVFTPQNFTPLQKKKKLTRNLKICYSVKCLKAASETYAHFAVLTSVHAFSFSERTAHHLWIFVFSLALGGIFSMK